MKYKPVKTPRVNRISCCHVNTDVSLNVDVCFICLNTDVSALRLSNDHTCQMFSSKAAGPFKENLKICLEFFCKKLKIMQRHLYLNSTIVET